jgi:uncharacterized protein YbbC (DUF1343 family)
LLLIAACPATASTAADRFSGIPVIVGTEIDAGHIPGAVILVGERGRTAYRGAFGFRSIIPKRTRLAADDIFDLASLTKAVATTTAVMQLVEAGRLELDRPVAAYWPEFGAGGKDAITARQLLTHMAGLPPDLDLGTPWMGEAAALAQVAALRPGHPPGSRFLYSDVGFIVLGELVHRISGEPLDVYTRRHIFAPLGMTDTGFRRPVAKRLRIVPTEKRDGEFLRGIVQDPTAFRMGGVAGHAGLFSTADDLAKFARMLLAHGTGHGVRILKPETVALMTAVVTLPGGTSRTLGWDVDSAFSGGIGSAIGAASYGHTGYTGTLLWIDPATDSFLVILTSRLHPDGRGNAKPLREQVARLVGRGLPADVLPGIDVLAAENFVALSGKRVALLTNQAGRDRAGDRTIDRLAQAPGVHLVSILTPEHGLSADREGRIEDGRDPATGLPIHSLYGANRRPTAEMLAGLDAIVIDLQDVGVRFFTYPTTVGYVLEEAARRGIAVIVLDRPNPINAAIVEGPVLEPELKSFTGNFPMPLRHGMTLGELATMFNVEGAIGARLTVVPMRGYRRDMWFDETGLAWTPPSPNLRSGVEAILYPGVGLVEGANVSVGRGTPTPFELVGAPWIDGKRLADYLHGRAIAGLRIEPAEFTPEADLYAGQPCNGARLTLTNHWRYDAASLGLELAAALAALYPDHFDLEGTRQLIGSHRVFAALKSGTDPRDLAKLWQPDLTAFRAIRAKYLIYR